MTTTKLSLPRYIRLVETDKENIIITVIKNCTKEQALQQVEQDRNTKIEPWNNVHSTNKSDRKIKEEANAIYIIETITK